MKKLLCVILAAVMLLGVFGCNAKDNNPGNESEKGDVTQELWSKVSGVWVYQEGGSFYFIHFTDGNDGERVILGTMFSGDMWLGQPEGVAKGEGETYEVKIYYPAVEANDENSGYEAFSQQLIIDLTKYGDGIILLRNPALTEQYSEYTYVGDDMDEANSFVTRYFQI